MYREKKIKGRKILAMIVVMLFICGLGLNGCTGNGSSQLGKTDPIRSEQRFYSTEDLERVRNEVGADSSRNTAYSEEVLKSLGFSAEDIDLMGGDEAAYLAKNTIEMTVFDYVCSVDEKVIVPNSDEGFHGTVIASRISPELADGKDGVYVLSCICRFNGAPVFRGEGKINCALQEIAWMQETEEYWSKMVCHYINPVSDETRISEDTQIGTMRLGTNGASFSWELPKDSKTMFGKTTERLTDLSSYMRCKVVIAYHTLAQRLELSGNYEHGGQVYAGRGTLDYVPLKKD